MTTLAIDIGTKMGWAVASADAIKCGMIDILKGVRGRKCSDGHRYLLLKRILTDLINTHGIKRIAFELVNGSTFKGKRAADLHIGYRSTLQLIAEELGLDLIPITVQAAKKAVTGSGNASKEAMIRAVRRLGIDTDNDNAADAAAVLIAERRGAGNGESENGVDAKQGARGRKGRGAPKKPTATGRRARKSSSNKV